MQMILVFLFFILGSPCSSPNGLFSLLELDTEMENMFPGKDGVSTYVGTTRWFVRPCGNTTETACVDGYANATGVCQQDLVPSLKMRTSGLQTTRIWENASSSYPLAESAFRVHVFDGNACGGNNASATINYVCNRTQQFESDNYGPNIGLYVLSWDGCHVELEWQSVYLCPLLSLQNNTSTSQPPPSTSSSADSGSSSNLGNDTSAIIGISVGGFVLIICCGILCICGAIASVLCLAVFVILSLTVFFGACSCLYAIPTGIFSGFAIRKARRKVHSGDFKISDLPPLTEDGYREIDIHDIKFGDCIGSGAFGDVYRGQWRSATVALKVVRVRSEESILEFRKEASLMTSLGNHINIVQFLGVACREGEQDTERRDLILVTRLYELGSLYQQFVRDAKEFEMQDFYDMIWDIATGLDYMHTRGLVHRDIALRNCLQGKDGRVVLSDFGISRFLGKDQDIGTTNSSVGPVRWMAPESLKEHKYSAASDIWSFGVTVWELWTRAMPYGNTPMIEVATRVTRNEITLPIPDGCPLEVAEIIRGCTMFNPEERMKLKDVFFILRDFSSRAGEKIVVQGEDEIHCVGYMVPDDSGLAEAGTVVNVNYVTPYAVPENHT